MSGTSGKHQRRSMRLSGYDYSQPGMYFVTICTQDRECLFGKIADGGLRLNEAGQMVEKWWAKLAEKFLSTETDEFVLMPNHLHGIIIFGGGDVGAAPCGRPGETKTGHPHGGAPTVGDIIDWFKTMTTNDYIRGVKHGRWVPFSGKLWQRNYYEHVIRNEDDLRRIREYIQTNPLRGELDRENPAKQGEDEFDWWLASLSAKKGRIKK
jgi:REP element-mobilizing transposase RayT